MGESGCGKSVTSLAAMRLLGETALWRADALRVCGQDLLGLNERELQRLRGRHIAMIFQDALSALNPVMTVGRQLDEIYLRHFRATKAEAKRRSIEALDLVGVPDPERRYHSFPHELSGGMRQRALIAMAFACDPDLIIADEPTTALDVTIQAQVLGLLGELQRQRGTALLLITHDLSVVAQLTDEICVMYSGKLVERAGRQALFARPLHPYTRGLIASVARMGDAKGDFQQIPGALPNPADKPEGCYFHPRCPLATDICREKMPPLRTLADGRQLRCWRTEGGLADGLEG